MSFPRPQTTDIWAPTSLNTEVPQTATQSKAGTLQYANLDLNYLSSGL